LFVRRSKLDLGLKHSPCAALLKQENPNEWASCHAIAVPVGSSSQDLRYLKSLTLHFWLLGYELPGGGLAPGLLLTSVLV
jgi:nucleosome binding factor SPN SPT16 subunit